MLSRIAPVGKPFQMRRGQRSSTGQISQSGCERRQVSWPWRFKSRCARTSHLQSKTISDATASRTERYVVE
jgi:hypothetical protein